ncbi:hypothetical protein BDV95DRAFT_493257 [Massariosphaeria phaeospora]|uniref:SnoaL-like domain-containing protein n=1 Tax=Massariosphaeria phaeospora TaxID=100035 RepID=A0A7C8I6U1_9PLEO|nr:hypothetical protein BDV95DRAFT_493257 [Massariosphaeria phaeospora]
MPSRERQTADTMVAAFNTMDTATIISLRTPTCQRIIRPSSLKYPPQSNTAYLANLNSMKSIFTNFHITVNDVIEGSRVDADGKESTTIVMFVEAQGDTPMGEYRNEYVWKMAFEEGGARIDEWLEYVDVGMARDFYPKLAGEMKRRTQENTEKVKG